MRQDTDQVTDHQPPTRVIGVHPLRAREPVRNLLHRSLVRVSDLVMPVLVRRSSDAEALPTVAYGEIAREARELWQRGIRGVKIFAAARRKDPLASEATDPDNLMLNAVKAFKDAQPDLCVITETCLCAYSDTGNCVLVAPDSRVDLSRTYEVLRQMAVLQADCGADVVGLAGMVDGSVHAVRSALDTTGHRDVAIMPHLIFDSSLYGLYRLTMGAQPREGHRRGFQIDPCRSEQALEQAQRFLNEGADMLLVEPALPMLDVLSHLRSALGCPIGAFSVSGEYQLLKGGTLREILDEKAVFLEFLGSLRRAGADLIITYAAKQIADWLRRESDLQRITGQL